MSATELLKNPEIDKRSAGWRLLGKTRDPEAWSVGQLLTATLGATVARDGSLSSGQTWARKVLKFDVTKLAEREPKLEIESFRAWFRVGWHYDASGSWLSAESIRRLCLALEALLLSRATTSSVAIGAAIIVFEVFGHLDSGTDRNKNLPERHRQTKWNGKRYDRALTAAHSSPT